MTLGFSYFWPAKVACSVSWWESHPVLQYIDSDGFREYIGIFGFYCLLDFPQLFSYIFRHASPLGRVMLVCRLVDVSTTLVRTEISEQLDELTWNSVLHRHSCPQRMKPTGLSSSAWGWHLWFWLKCLNIFDGLPWNLFHSGWILITLVMPTLFFPLAPSSALTF